MAEMGVSSSRGMGCRCIVVCMGVFVEGDL